MKRIFTFFITLFFWVNCLVVTEAQRYGADPETAFLLEDFDAATVLPFSTQSGAFQLAGQISLVDQKMQFFGSGSGNRGLLANIYEHAATGLVHLEFDWNVGNAISEVGKYSVLTIRDNSNNILLGFMVENWANSADVNSLHCFNLDPAAMIRFTGNDNCITYGTSLEESQTLNSATLFAGKTFSLLKDYRIKAVIDFATKKIVSLTVTRLDTEESATVSNLNFIQDAAAGVNRMDFVTYRNSGSSSNWTTTIDNIRFYPPTEVANVVIKYENQLGGEIQASRIAVDQVVGKVFEVAESDKAMITFEGQNYTFDASSSTSVTVASGDVSEIVLKFEEATEIYSYIWTGSQSSIWDFSALNFSAFETLSQTNAGAAAYVNGQAAVFPPTAVNKSVVLDEAVSLGSNEMNVSGAYAFSGIGSLNGTGTLQVTLEAGQVASLAIENNLSGGTSVEGGTIALGTNSAAGNLLALTNSNLALTEALTTDLVLSGEVALNSDAVITSAVSGTGKMVVNNGFNLDISGLNGFSGGVDFNGAVLNLGHSNALGTGMVSFADGAIVNFTSSIPNALHVESGVVTYNYPNSQWVGLGSKSAPPSLSGSGTLRLNFNQLRALLNTDNRNFSGTLVVNGNSVSDILILETSLAYGDHLTLDLQSGSLFGNYSSGSGTSYFSIGALKGSVGNVLGNPSSTTGTNRPQVYRIGATNLSTEFSGNIIDKMYNKEAASGTGVGIEKIGTGELTLSGSNTYSNPTVVKMGSLNISGSLGGSSVSVETGGQLRGTGVINGPTVVDGLLIYEGMQFANNLSLNGNAELMVNSLTDDYFSVGGVFVCGGALTVKLGNGLVPAIGDRLYVFDPANLPTGVFSQVVVEGSFSWSVDKLYSDGYIEALNVLTNLKPQTVLKVVDRKYYSITGVEVLETTKGVLIEKQIFEDGSVHIDKVINTRN